MGIPTPLVMSEMHLQYLEYTYIFYILIKCGVIGYFRNVSDILIAYSFIHTSAEELLEEFNSFSSNLDFTLEKEQNINLNILDITINRYNAQSEWQFRISILENPQLQTVFSLRFVSSNKPQTGFCQVYRQSFKYTCLTSLK
jgi:hypothetical protein